MPVDAGLANEGHCFTQRLDGGCKQKVSTEFDQIGGRGLRADRERLLSHRVEQGLAGADRYRVARGYDEELCRSSRLGTAEHRRRDEALSRPSVRLRQVFL